MCNFGGTVYDHVCVMVGRWVPIHILHGRLFSDNSMTLMGWAWDKVSAETDSVSFHIQGSLLMP